MSSDFYSPSSFVNPSSNEISMNEASDEDQLRLKKEKQESLEERKLRLEANRDKLKEAKLKSKLAP